MRDSVVFYRSFYEAVKNLPPEEFKESMQAILNYSFDGKPPDTQGSIAHTVFTLVKPQIDANNQRYENGKKGGKKPNPNQDGTKPEPNRNQTVTETKPNPNQTVTKPEPNVNVNVNVNVNDKDKNNMSGSEDGTPTHPEDKSADGAFLDKSGEVVDYLNQAAGTAFRKTSKDTKKHIRARFNDGYTLDDFKTVIDRRVEEWKGTEWEKFLRPSTLLGSKFESYLNQKEEPKGKKTAFSNFLERDYDKSLMDSLVGR